MFVEKFLDIANSQLSNSGKYKKQWIEMGNDYLFSLWGFIVHLILLWGVLDVNFHSPIIKDLPVVPAPSGSPAKRVLLFVADGLRFQTFIDKPPPFLRYSSKLFLLVQTRSNSAFVILILFLINFKIYY